MHPHPAEEVVFREAYAAQGESAQVYLLAHQWQGVASIYPKDPRQRTYPPHDPAAICPPHHQEVPLGLLRHIKSPAQDALQQAVIDGKYRTIAGLLKAHPLLDAHGYHDFPSLFHAIEIQDMKRWRKTAEVLVNHGASLHHGFAHANCNRWTLAHQAVHARQYDKLDALAGMGVALDPIQSDLDLLGLAIRRKDFDAIGALFLRGLATAGLDGLVQDLHSHYDRYDRTTYQASPLGMTLPVPHRALLQSRITPEHLDAFRQVIGAEPWEAARDEHGRSAMEMALHLGGAVLERALPLQAHLQHDALQTNIDQVRPTSNTSPGRRL